MSEQSLIDRILVSSQFQKGVKWLRKKRKTEELSKLAKALHDLQVMSITSNMRNHSVKNKVNDLHLSDDVVLLWSYRNSVMIVDLELNNISKNHKELEKDIQNAPKVHIKKTIVTNRDMKTLSDVMSESVGDAVDYSGLKKAFQIFDKNGKYARNGNWEIGKGGYDLDFEISFKRTPIVDCVLGHPQIISQDNLDYFDIDGSKVLEIISNFNKVDEKLSPQGYEPKKTGKAYKVFKVRNGKLYPPMVANAGGEDTPVGVWLDAEEGEFAGLSKTGRPQVKSTGGETLSYRPGWHLGDVPRAPQFDRTNKQTGEKEFPKDFVWAECDYAMDIDYQPESDEQGYMRTKVDDKGNVVTYRSDKYQHSLAGLPKLPKDGYYKYRTNPRPDTVPWVITGQMRVNKLLSDDEVNEILKSKGIEPIHRQGGDKTLRELGLNESFSEKQLKTREIPTIGAYSGQKGRTLSKCIYYKEDKEMASSKPYTEGIQFEPEDREKGGIIIFSTEVNAKELSTNAVANWIKQKISSLSNRVNRFKKIDRIGKKHDLVGWTVGKYLSGRYTAKNGKAFGEDSLSLEIIGVDTDTLFKIAEDVCREFNQEAVLVKDYSTGRILFIDAE